MADDKKDEGGTYEDIKGSGGFLTGIPNVTSDTFTGTNNETGEKEEVVAWDAEHAAEKFSEGKGEPKKQPGPSSVEARTKKGPGHFYIARVPMALGPRFTLRRLTLPVREVGQS